MEINNTYQQFMACLNEGYRTIARTEDRIPLRTSASPTTQWNKSSDASLLRSNRGVTSATSSTVTVLTSSNDSTGLTPLAPPVRHHNYHKHRLYNGNMTPSNQKELNVLYGQNNFSPIGDDELVKKEKDPAVIDTSYTIQDGEGGDDFTLSKDESLPIKNDFSEPTRKIAYFPQVLAALSVSVCSMAVGFASAYTSPALVSMRESNSTVTVSGQEASWIGGLMPLAALVGGIAGGPLIELVGRKATILSTAVPFILSWLLIALAINVPMILTGRAIAGFCVGIASLCLPVYLGETLQPEVRGMLGLLPTTLGNVGILLCFTAGSYLDWSQLAILGASIPVPFLILMFLIPETPRWYISKDKNGEAKKALQWLRGKDADISSEFAEIQKTHKEAEKNATDSMSDLFTKANVKPLMISIGLMFFQQFSGINAVIFYTVQIFKDAGSTIDKNVCTIIVGVVNFGSTFVATMLIDRLGRKVLLYISAISMTVSLLTLGTFFYVRHEGYDVTSYGWLPLASFVTFVIGFSLGYGPIPWLMMGEILPAKIRGTAASVATGFNWSCTFIVTKTFTDVINVMGTYGTFWMFGIICFVGLFFIIFCVPETQGKSLEDIEKKFTGPVRRMSAIANLRPLPLSV